MESIVTYMPPTAGDVQNTAIFLRRQDVAPALQTPLERTLTPPKGSLRPGQMKDGDLEAVRRYTNDRVYQYRFQQLQDGTPVLVLAPLRT